MMAAHQGDPNQNLFRGAPLFQHARFAELSDEEFTHFLTEHDLDVNRDRDLVKIYSDHFNSIRNHHIETFFRGLQS